ncbi:MAG: hypothetical protein ACHQ1H_06770, partial [Nitrososphaerales archaeon]
MNCGVLAKESVYQLPQLPPDSVVFPLTLSFLETSLEGVAVLGALSQSEAKLLGARLKNDR